eukprot:scaffold98736_cov66-Phaeocystis_antarctica.AAC.3
MPAAEHVRDGGGGGRRRRRARPHPAARETSRCVTTRGADEASHAVLEVDERCWLVRRRVEEALAPRSDGVNVATCLYIRWRAVHSLGKGGAAGRGNVVRHETRPVQGGAALVCLLRAPLFYEAVQTVEIPVGAAGVDLKGREVPPARDVGVKIASVLHPEPRLLARALAAKALARYPVAARHNRGQRIRIAVWVRVLVASLVPEAE